MFTTSIYSHSPIFAQDILVTLRAFVRSKLRENQSFRDTLNIIRKHDFSKSSCDIYKSNRLKETVLNSVLNVPFYTDLNIELTDFYKARNEELIGNFPIINKTTLITQHAKFFNPKVKGVMVLGATSGTTGTPLAIPQSISSVISENAFIWRQLEWAGYKRGEKRAWLRGDMIVPTSQKKPPFWRNNYAENMIYLSSFHLSMQNSPLYIKKLEDFNPVLIQAYPTSICFLAKYLEDNNLYYGGKCTSIVTSSEFISKRDKDLIEARFGAKVYDWYGLFERNAAIGTCEYGKYHLIDDYSYVELLPNSSGAFSVIGTAFNNPRFPLIRYDTGDTVELPKHKTQCECGRHYKVIERINGRIGDYLIGNQGQKVFILNHIVKGISGIIESQFIQNTLDCIQVKVVAGPKFGIAEEEKLIKSTKLRVGGAVKIVVEKVTSISRDKSGKFRQAITDPALDNLAG